MSSNKKFRIQNGVDITGQLIVGGRLVIDADGTIAVSTLEGAVTTAFAAEVTTLQTQIDALLEASPESLDTLQEIVALFQSEDNDLSTLISQNAAAIAALQAQIVSKTNTSEVDALTTSMTGVQSLLAVEETTSTGQVIFSNYLVYEPPSSSGPRVRETYLNAMDVVSGNNTYTLQPPTTYLNAGETDVKYPSTDMYLWGGSELGFACDNDSFLAVSNGTNGNGVFVWSKDNDGLPTGDPILIRPPGDVPVINTPSHYSNVHYKSEFGCLQDTMLFCGKYLFIGEPSYNDDEGRVCVYNTEDDFQCVNIFIRDTTDDNTFHSHNGRIGRALYADEFRVFWADVLFDGGDPWYHNGVDRNSNRGRIYCARIYEHSNVIADHHVDIISCPHAMQQTHWGQTNAHTGNWDLDGDSLKFGEIMSASPNYLLVVVDPIGQGSLRYQIENGTSGYGVREDYQPVSVFVYDLDKTPSSNQYIPTGDWLINHASHENFDLGSSKNVAISDDYAIFNVSPEKAHVYTMPDLIYVGEINHTSDKPWTDVAIKDSLVSFTCTNQKCLFVYDIDSSLTIPSKIIETPFIDPTLSSDRFDYFGIFGSNFSTVSGTSTTAFPTLETTSTTVVGAINELNATFSSLSGGTCIDYNASTGVISVDEADAAANLHVATSSDTNSLDGQDGDYYRLDVYDANDTIIN